MFTIIALSILRWILLGILLGSGAALGYVVRGIYRAVHTVVEDPDFEELIDGK